MTSAPKERAEAAITPNARAGAVSLPLFFVPIVCLSLKSPGLYFIGEVLDVTGHLGGFNFQWAWASGYAAAQYA